ncbi:holo-ACP synthase [Paenibacillus ehimensis]|uniref:Holo-[acyl-carrier-protein] synthase n=1 Tax=Paenibacillus ehimensis TaxID=79264 RepID=A0ABT8VHY1_9BACL|nr:holo-ACP synthase [Paenibacillus ehimensis]MDO3680594.1 holo-ACP synthase [Paenibacillus ehimensis]MEC0207855.1 holo-ACP synthase [Paenibacillus ehimensis]
MIIGIGTDVLEIERMRKILGQPSGKRFLERVLTPAERELAAVRGGRLAEFAAGRFAAKEAVVKALGCGIGKEVGFQDMEVLPDGKGKPVCRLSEAAWERLAVWMPAFQSVREDTIRIHLSITHSETLAMAYAVAERIIANE